jgi:hypothetical protein
MKGKKEKRIPLILLFFGEVSDYLLTNYRTRRFSTVRISLGTAFHFLKALYRTELCSV